MKTTRREHLQFLGGAAAATTLAPTAVLAQDDDDGTPDVHEVLMLNAHPDNRRERQVFFPDLVRAKVGDTIKFIAEDRGHNSQSEEDWSPEGGTEWDGRINEEVEVVIETEGAYMYKCQPHASAGMIGLLLVGDVSGNYEDLKGERFRGKAGQRAEDIFARADALLAEEAEGNA
ncbi:MAG: plastocyanin/azurin family copper-binding protein [Shimia sp.]